MKVINEATKFISEWIGVIIMALTFLVGVATGAIVF